MRRGEDVHEMRQQRLSRVQVEERGEPGQDDRQRRRSGGIGYIVAATSTGGLNADITHERQP